MILSIDCINIIRIEGKKYYFFSYDGDDIYNYYKGTRQNLLAKELEAIDQYEIKYQNPLNKYNIDKYDAKRQRIGNNRSITMQRYSMGGNIVPLISIDDFVTNDDGDEIAMFGDDVFDNREQWKKDYDDSIQYNNRRIKAQCRLFHSTTWQNKQLQRCELRWTDLFQTKKQQRIVKQAIMDAYTALNSEYVIDIEWLKSGNVGEEPMVLLLANYHGGGIAAHCDDYFDGHIRGEMDVRFGEKKFSLDMKMKLSTHEQPSKIRIFMLYSGLG